MELIMRFVILGCAAVLTLSSLPAMAEESFIPMGQAFALGENEVPPLGSEQDRMNAQTDIYETEVFRRELRNKQLDSQLNQLVNQQELGALDNDWLDY
jgi:hypothetical protein